MTTCLGNSYLFGLLCIYCKRLPVCVCASLPFCFERATWDLIVLEPDHCLSFYFKLVKLLMAIKDFNLRAS